MSQTQSSNSNNNRNRPRRSGGGGNRTQGGGGNRQGGNRNQGKGGGGGGNRNRSRGKRPAPKPPTFWEKLLYTISFGNFGKPDLSRDRKPQSDDRKSDKPVASSKPRSEKPRQEKPKRREEKPKRAPELVEVTTERLYVGNLSYDATEADLYDLFSGVGQVKDAEVVVHRHTQRSKGYAFVEMTTVDEAKRAVDVLHDQDYMGRSLCVSGAKSNGPSEGSEEENKNESSADESEDSVTAAA